MVVTSALENIVNRYKARFRPDPQTNNMLYYSGERATPARLSHEQYDNYVEEFETFIIASKRTLFWQAILMFIFAIAVSAAAVYFLGFDIIDNKHAEDIFMYCGMTLWMLPGIYQFWKGTKLFRKPTRELTLLPEGVVAPLSKREIVDRRLMGMSEGMIIGTALFAAIGIVLELAQGLPRKLEDYKLIAFFGAAIVSAIYVWKRKARAHKADDDIHAKQQSKLE